MDKVYNHKDVEERIYKKWEESGYFKPCVIIYLMSEQSGEGVKKDQKWRELGKVLRKEKETSPLTQPIGNFDELKQRYVNVLNILRGISILKSHDISQYVEEYNADIWGLQFQDVVQAAEFKISYDVKDVINNRDYILQQERGYAITQEQAEVAAKFYLDFTGLLRQNLFNYQGSGSTQVTNHLTVLEVNIEHYLRLSSDEFEKLVKQEYKWDINPATIERKYIESLGDRQGLEYMRNLSQKDPDIDYKTAVGNKSDFDGIAAHMAKSHPEQVHMYKLYEKVLAPYFQRKQGFGPPQQISR